MFFRLYNEEMSEAKKKEGFSLMELVIVITIIAILVCVTVSFYGASVIKARRANVVIALNEIAIRLEQYYARNNKYKGAKLDDLKVNDEGYRSFYSIAVEAKDGEYVLYAKPIGAQEKGDVECGTLILEQNGNKQTTGKGNARSCWVGM